MEVTVGGVVERTEMGSCWRALSRQCFSHSLDRGKVDSKAGQDPPCPGKQ